MVVLAGLVVAACGSSSDPNTLLNQTFSGTHKVTSGDLNLTLTIDPSGSSVVNGPIAVSFGGPFQIRGSGKLPESNFTVSVSAMGQDAALGILSTGTAGYVTLQGTSYQLPPATFQNLESSFAQLASSPGGAGSSGTLAKLGIDPLQWLTNPTIVGTENVGGAQTTHIHAGVNSGALLNDMNTFLQKASSVTPAGTQSLKSGLSAATRSKIAAAVEHPSVDIWTGTSDKTIRRLTIASADIELTMQYSDLNQPQTITAPTNLRPFSEFQGKLAAFEQTLQGAAAGVLGNRGG
ncbi:MAG: hypothetical protein JO363_20540 [Solirubrobacterales bacterium]|nr:hypothetical protein [Solirubrobacterales bacterium]